MVYYEIGIFALIIGGLVSIMIGVGITNLRRNARLRTEKKYRFECTCNNCKKTEIFEIQIGESVREFLIGKKCSRCGCNLRNRSLVSTVEEEKDSKKVDQK
jgi:hypothetical protein